MIDGSSVDLIGKCFHLKVILYCVTYSVPRRDLNPGPLAAVVKARVLTTSHYQASLLMAEPLQPPTWRSWKIGMGRVKLPCQAGMATQAQTDWNETVMNMIESHSAQIQDACTRINIKVICVLIFVYKVI